MKKTVSFFIALLFLCGISTLSFAQAVPTPTPTKSAKKDEVKMEVIKGEIVSIDTTANQIVVKDKKTAQDRTIGVDPKEIAKLTVGEKVKIKIKEGSTIAESVKKIKSDTKKAK